MKFSQFLLEMPMRFNYEEDDSVIELNDDEENEYQYEEIKNEKLISKINGYDIVQHKMDSDIVYDILDRENKRILYRCVTHKGYTVEGINFTISSKIWKNKDFDADVVDIFYDVILKKSNNAIYSSGSHTSAGERYWDKLVKAAFNKGYSVGIINLFIGSNKQKTLKRVESYSEYRKLKPSIYSTKKAKSNIQGDKKVDVVISIFKE